MEWGGEEGGLKLGAVMVMTCQWESRELGGAALSQSVHEIKIGRPLPTRAWPARPLEQRVAGSSKGTPVLFKYSPQHEAVWAGRECCAAHS